MKDLGTPQGNDSSPGSTFPSVLHVSILFTILAIILAWMLPSLRHYARIYRQFVAGGTVPNEVLKSTNLVGKTIVITGGNTGIGFESARIFYQLGAHVLLLCRDEQKAKVAVEQIESLKKSNGGDLYKKEKWFVRSPPDEAKIEYMIMDLGDLDSVVQCAQQINDRGINISVLLYKAGQMMPPHATTRQGFELQYGVNYLGHFLLTHKLMDNLVKNGARVISAGSIAHCFYWFTNPFRSQYIDYGSIKGDAYGSFKVDLYSRSKWAMMLFARELQKRFSQMPSCQATSYSLHPGSVLTELPRHVPTLLMIPTRLFKWFVLKEPLEGAQTSIYLSIMPGVEKHAGEYFADCKVKRATSATYKDEIASELWDKTVELLSDYL